MSGLRQIAPGVSFEQWVTMEGFESMAAYIAHMQRPGTWVDTPMLTAASGLFGMQIIVFVGRGDPQLLAAPSVQNLLIAPMATIACVANVHFFAVHPEVHDVDTHIPQPAEPCASSDAELLPLGNGGAASHEQAEPSEDCIVYFP